MGKQAFRSTGGKDYRQSGENGHFTYRIPQILNTLNWPYAIIERNPRKYVINSNRTAPSGLQFPVRLVVCWGGQAGALGALVSGCKDGSGRRRILGLAAVGLLLAVVGWGGCVGVDYPAGELRRRRGRLRRR